MKPSTHSGRMSQEALLGLWRTYKETGDTKARDRLVFSLAPVVKAIVYRKIREIPAYREVDDYISCGLEALIKSLDRYDPERAPRSSSSPGPASTAPSSTSSDASTGRRAPCGAWSASSTGSASAST